jgi:hypothetical protein
MLRAMIVVLASLSLAGCWVSDTRLFGPADWAHVDLAGKYKSEDANGNDEAKVVLTVRPNGLIAGTSTDLKSGKVDHSMLGLVAIKGGSGKYFIAVDRSDQAGKGDIYMIAHLTDEKGLEVFWPDCDGTAPVQGMVRQLDDLTHTGVCKFSSKQALMTAGLQAEKFLSAKHVIAIAPFGKLVPDDGSSSDSDAAK